MFTDKITLDTAIEMGILIYVALEYYESRATNQYLTKLFNRQRKSKQKISVDKIIKDVVTKSNET